MKKRTYGIVAALVAVCAAVGVAFWLLSSGAPSYDKICRMNDDLKQSRQLGLSTQEKCAERLGAAILKTTDETVLANLLANVSFEERFANAILGKIQSPEMLETVARTFKAELIADSADNPFSESLYDAVLDRLPDDSAVERISLDRLAEIGGASDARTGARAKKSSGKSELAACLCRRILAMDDAGRAEALLEKMGKSDVLRELPFETRLGIALRSKSEKVRNDTGVDREYLELGDLVAKWDPDCLSRSVREIIVRGREIKNAQEYIEVVKRFDPDFRSNDIDTWVEYAKSVTPVLEAIDRLSANSKSDSSDSFRRSRLVEKRDKAKKEHDEWQKVANDLRAGQSNPDPATFIAACQFVGVYFDPDDIGDTGTRLGTKLRRLLNESESELKEAESELAAFDRAVSSQRDSMNGQIAKLKSQLEQIRQRYETPEARKAREKREAAERKAREEREAAEREAREKAKREAYEKAIPELIKDMVQIPGKNYMLGRTEVTQLQWESIMGEENTRDSEWNMPIFFNAKWKLQRQISSFLEKLNSHHSVVEANLQFRLPTQEEWEGACYPDKQNQNSAISILKGGEKVTWDDIEKIAWWAGNSGGHPHAVAQKNPNIYGLYDTIGNVWELVSRKDEVKYWACGGGCNGTKRWNRGPLLGVFTLGFLPADDMDGPFGFRLCAERKGK